MEALFGALSIMEQHRQHALLVAEVLDEPRLFRQVELPLGSRRLLVWPATQLRLHLQSAATYFSHCLKVGIHQSQLPVYQSVE